MKKGLLVTRSCELETSTKEKPAQMLHAGLDLSRKRLDVCLLADDGEHLEQLAVPP